MKRSTPRLDLNPSSSDRWTTCTASPQFIYDNWDKVPSDRTRYNDEGHTAHEVACAFLQNREPDVSDKNKYPTPIDGDMRWHGWQYMEYVEGLREEGSTLLVEQKLPLWYMPGRNAIVDAIVINPNSIHVIDLKYGEGVPVSPVENKQVVIYAKTAFVGTEFMDDFPVFGHIYQPRGRAGESGPAHVWETDWGTVQKIATAIQKESSLIRNVHDRAESTVFLQFAPSEKACQWCPAKGFCVARQQYLTQDLDALTVIDAEPLTLPAANVIPLDQLSHLLKHKSHIEKWLKDASEWATEHMRAGGKIPGFKLVTSRGGNRAWSNEEKAAALLLEETVLKENEVWDKSLKSPAAIEKLVGKKKFTAEILDLITKAPGVPVIAPEDDPREAIADVRDEFEVLP